MAKKETLLSHITFHVSRFTRIIMVVSLITISCRPSEDPLPRIRYGEETCDRCRMIISEKRFAAAYRTASGTLRKFDDLGCGILHLMEQGEAAEQFWGYDHEETAWIEANQGFFVYSSNLSTPMGYGIVTLSTMPKAEKFATQTTGQILQFDQLHEVIGHISKPD